MTLVKPFLALRRLIVWSNGKAAYDEKFVDGVNIIRGTNSSGKSTIADFIFYALGGDFNKWKHEAAMCDYVIAEVQFNDSVLTLKRKIESTARQPMMIFWGASEAALSSALEGWQIFPFSRGSQTEVKSEKESFSRVLFRALDFPEVRGDADSNLSMHQVLRLIFLDQVSPIDSLLRMEQFDSALTRNTIGDLLLGLYDNNLYSDQLALAKKEKELEALKNQYESIIQVFGEAEHETDLDAINRQLSELDIQRKKVETALREDDKVDDATLDQEAEERIKHLKSAAVSLKGEYAKLEAENESLTLEVEDSRMFLISLRKRVAALDDANITRQSLGQLPITSCPHCLAPIGHSPDPTVCPLCKEKAPPSEQLTYAMRMRQELSQQIAESELLLTRKQTRLEQIRRRSPELREHAAQASQRYNEAITSAKTKRDESKDQLLITKGALDAKIEYLHKQAKAVTILASIKERRITVESEISRLRISVQDSKQKQQSKKHLAQQMIEEKSLYLLRNDLPLEETFKFAKTVSFDFGSNSFAVNGENQFSASSMVYLKNSIHFAILWASIELSFFRYPRIFICDNIEDKGMHPTRSQNFQRLLVSISQEEFKVAHQIIFTTSMIDSELNNSKYCVGPEYGPKNKTLKLG